MELQVILLLIFGCLISIIGAYLTWKYADFFMTRRDYYVNSKFDLLKKKLSLSLGVAGAIIIVTIMVVNLITDKNEKQNNKQPKWDKKETKSKRTIDRKPDTTACAEFL